jgi:hypothetical protein
MQSFENDASFPRGALFTDTNSSELKASSRSNGIKSGTKKKSSASTNNSITIGDNGATPAVRQAKEDLLRLGIELDDELITRLQNNLGIDKIFDVAHQAATILAPQPSLDLAVTNQEIAFRHVSHGNAKVGFSLDARQPVHASLQPFVSDLIAINPKHSIQILKQLDNRADEIEPQYRPQLDQMIQSFRLQYSRAPCRFIGRLLGRKWNSATDKNQEESLITRWILKTRYVTKQDFATMILRVAPKANIEVVNTLFTLLREEKQFGNPQKHVIVDLWAFLTLLKTASEESRRSFDAATSKLATDVEFWRNKNAGGVSSLYGLEQPNHNSNNNNNTGTGGIVQKTGLPLQPTIEEGWRVFENLEAANIRHIESREKRSHVRKSANTVTPSSSSSSSSAAATVATLLGQPQYRHHAEASSGRAVMGRLYQETVNACDIPAALNSPPHLQRRPHSANLPHDALQREDALPIPPAQYVHDSRNVAFLLNNQDYVHKAMTIERPPSANILQRELLNNTSVAYALGRTEKPIKATTQAHHASAKELQNLGAVLGGGHRGEHPTTAGQKNSLASYYVQHGHSGSGGSNTTTNTTNTTATNTNNNNNSNERAAAGKMTRGQSSSNITGRMRMSSVNALHWEDIKPSVATALGGK